MKPKTTKKAPAKKLVISKSVKKFLSTPTKKPAINIELVIEMIIEGDSYRTMAKKLKVKLTKLHDFTSKEEHSARVREAMNISADTFAEMAEEVLLKAKLNQWSMAKARELAQHYRWKASKRRPKTYGDKVQTELSGSLDIKQITGMQIK